jgi:transcriptional regulator with XRE-family HTH domain
MQAIGKKIRKLRELKELTQEYIASEIGLSQSAYSKIEAGETDITYQRLEKIADILEVKPEDIIAFNEQMIFNLHHNQTAQGFVMHNHVSQIERELYEQTISFLREEISLLKEMVLRQLK